MSGMQPSNSKGAYHLTVASLKDLRGDDKGSN